MTQLFSSPESAEIGLIQSQLETAGIACEIRNDNISTAMAGAAFNAELWVLRDEDVAAARELLAAWSQGPMPPEAEAEVK